MPSLDLHSEADNFASPGMAECEDVPLENNGDSTPDPVTSNTAASPSPEVISAHSDEENTPERSSHSPLSASSASTPPSSTIPDGSTMTSSSRSSGSKPLYRMIYPPPPPGKLRPAIFYDPPSPAPSSPPSRSPSPEPTPMRAPPLHVQQAMVSHYHTGPPLPSYREPVVSPTYAIPYVHGHPNRRIDPDQPQFGVLNFKAKQRAEPQANPPMEPPDSRKATWSIYTAPVPAPAPTPEPATVSEDEPAVSDSEEALTVHGKRRMKRLHSRPKPADHVARPANAWVLFRSEFNKKSKESMNHKSGQVISSEASEVWKYMPKDEKEEWYAKAKVESEKHATNNPGYRYQPHRTSSKGVKDKDAASTSTTKLKAKPKRNAQHAGSKSLSPSSDDTPGGAQPTARVGGYGAPLHPGEVYSPVYGHQHTMSASPTPRSSKQPTAPSAATKKDSALAYASTRVAPAVMAMISHHYENQKKAQAAATPPPAAAPSTPFFAFPTTVSTTSITPSPAVRTTGTARSPDSARRFVTPSTKPTSFALTSYKPMPARELYRPDLPPPTLKLDPRRHYPNAGPGRTPTGQEHYASTHGPRVIVPTPAPLLQSGVKRPASAMDEDVDAEGESDWSIESEDEDDDDIDPVEAEQRAQNLARQRTAQFAAEAAAEWAKKRARVGDNEKRGDEMDEDDEVIRPTQEKQTGLSVIEKMDMGRDAAGSGGMMQAVDKSSAGEAPLGVADGFNQMPIIPGSKMGNASLRSVEEVKV